jgi:glycosyltransferase involved in cell wall biosynthesis
MAMGTGPMTKADNPVCSVCIANYNGIDVIGAAVNSVIAQDCDFPVEIIIHDDASTDGSVDYIREKFPEVKLITSEHNVGFCISNNRMVANAKGKYIMLLNNDAKLFPNALSVLYDYTVKKKDAAGILGLPQYDAITGNLIDFGSLLDPFLNTIPNLGDGHRCMPMVAQMAMDGTRWIFGIFSLLGRGYLSLLPGEASRVRSENNTKFRLLASRWKQPRWW